MSREKAQGLIYKLVRYSDSSAIGFAFTREYGRLKLFIPKAYTKKGGVICFMPGVLDFSKKQSDLSRYYGFDHDPNYYHFIDNHDIILRFHLLFEVFDGMFEPESPDEKLYDLVLKINDENFRKITPYIIYFILKRSGVMYDLNTCSSCGSEENLFTVAKDGIYCDTCANLEKIKSFCDKETAYILKSMGKASLYRNVTVNRKQEIQLIDSLSAYCEIVLEKKLKSKKTLLDII
jgi:DNA repair protein RecO (recombination protein O)